MSIFSPRSSCTTACTRLPFMPTHAPTGSTSESRLDTAIFARPPGSRAAASMTTMPSAISGTSISNSLVSRFTDARDRTICGPLDSRSTSSTYAWTRSPGR